jgi:hypothetical protein
VNLDKLGRKLRREAVANPKKAAILGLVTVLALYFWAPLLRGWFATDKPGVPAATEAATVTVAAGAQPAAAARAASEKPAVGLPSWQQVVEWRHKDSRTMIAPVLAQTRDPFETPIGDEPQMVAEDKLKAKPPIVAPAAAGLVLTSTIIGPQRRIVQINGEIYRVGQTIETGKGKDSPTTKYKLIEVHPRRAVLEADGEQFELTIPEPESSDKIHLLGAVSGQ